MSDPFGGLVTSDPFANLNDASNTSTLTTPAAKNNNPGNLRIPNTKEWQSFATPQEGYNALINDIKAKQSGQTSTGLNGDSSLIDLIRHYAPTSDSNDPTAYASTVARRLGVDTSTAIGKINATDLAPHIAHVEDNKYWDSIKDQVNLSGPSNTQNATQPTRPTPAATQDPFANLVAPQQQPLINIPGFPYASGLASSVANVPHSIFQAVNTPLAPIPGLAPNAAPSTSDLQTRLKQGLGINSNEGPIGALGSVVKGFWNSTVGFLDNQATALADFANKGGTLTKDMVSIIPGMDNYLLATQAKPMTDAERFQAGANFGTTAVTIGAGMIAGEAMGAEAKTVGGFSTVPEVMAKLPTSAQAEIIQQAANKTLGNSINHGIAFGVAASVTMSLAQEHADGNDVLDDAFNYGIAGGILGGVGAKVFGGSRAQAASDTKLAVMKQTIGRTMAQDFTGDASVDFANDLTKGVDLVKAYKDNMDKGSVKVITGMPTMTPENLSDASVGRYRNEDGTFNALIQSSEGTPALTSDQIKQFNSEGYVSGETVSRNGSDFIYDGKSDASGLLKLRNIATDATVYAPESEVYRPNQFRLGDIEAPVQEFDASTLPDDLKAQIKDNSASLSNVNSIAASDNAQKLVMAGYYTDPATNGYTIRSFTDPSFSAPLESHIGIQDFLNNTMRTPDSAVLLKDIQSPDLQALTAAGNHSIIIPQTGQVSWRQSAWDTFNQKTTVPLTIIPTDKMLALLARKYGLDIGDTFFNVQDAVKKASAARQPFIDAANNIYGPILSADDETHNLSYNHARALSVEQFMQHGIYQDGQPPSPQVLDNARDLISTGSTMEDRVVANHYAIARARGQSLLADGSINQQQFQQYMDGLDKIGNYGQPISDIQRAVADKIDAMHQASPLDHWSTLLAADVLQNPERFPTQTQYAADNNLSPEIVNMNAMESTLYGQLSDKEREADSPIRARYLPVIARLGGAGLLDMSPNGAYRFIPPQIGEFVHNMANIGYIDPSVTIKDQPALFARYLNGLMRQNYIDPALAALRQKIQDITKDPTFSMNPKKAEAVQALVNLGEYVDNAVKGFSDPNDVLGRQATEDQLGSLMGSKTKGTSVLETLTSALAAKYIGFDPTIAARHAAGIMETAQGIMGPGYTAQLFGNLSRGLSLGQDLSESGITPAPLGMAQITGSQLPTAGLGASIGQKLASGVSAVSEAGLKASGLPQVFKWLSATTYLTTSDIIDRALVRYTQDVTTNPTGAMKQLMKDVQINVYDPGEVAGFRSRLEAGDLSGATDFLATRSVGKLVGDFSKANNPQLFKNTAGRVIGQLGIWKMFELQNLIDMAAKGSKTAAALKLTRMMAMSAGGIAAGNAIGLNLHSWAIYDPTKFKHMIAPNSMGDFINGVTGTVAAPLPNESPMLTLLAHLKDAGNPTSPTSAFSQTMLDNSIWPPIPNEFSNIIEGAQRQAQGDPITVWLGKMLGANVNTSDYRKPNFNLFDY